MPSFNEAELLERVDHDLAFLAETVAMLESDAPALLAEIDAALASADAPAVSRAAHALKGMISNFCAPSAQESALALERLGKAGDLAGAPAALSRTRARVAELIGELTAYIKAGGET